MKANELRIGNWYMSTKFQCPVICEMGDFYEIYARADGSSEYNVDDIFEPIPLTEEWLLKFGFKKQDEFYVISDDLSHYIELLNVRDEWYPWLVELPELSHQSEQKVCIPYIKYVHQLQNLYFALTGEELEIKEK